MTLDELLKTKQRAVMLTVDDLIESGPSPLWRPKPGHGQTWRHSCKLCGHIFLDDTHQYEVPSELWRRDFAPHFLEKHN